MAQDFHLSPFSSDLVSVVIPMFNSEKWIRQTLVSVLEQDYDSFEVLVINDGSTDNSVGIVKEVASRYTDVKLKLLSIPNSGVSFARNLGIKESNGKYVALLDSDDVWHPQKLSVQVKFLDQNQHCIGVLCDFYISLFKENKSSLKNVRLISNRDSKSLGRNWLNLEGNGALLSSTILLNRDFPVDFALFDSELSTTADLYFFLQLISIGEVGQVNLPLVQYRLHENQMHSNPDNLRQEIPLLLSKLGSLNFPHDHNRIMANVSVMCSILSLNKHNYRTAILDIFQAFQKRPFSVLQIPYKILTKRLFGNFYRIQSSLIFWLKGRGNEI